MMDETSETCLTKIERLLKPYTNLDDKIRNNINAYDQMHNDQMTPYTFLRLCKHRYTARLEELGFDEKSIKILTTRLKLTLDKVKKLQVDEEQARQIMKLYGLNADPQRYVPGQFTLGCLLNTFDPYSVFRYYGNLDVKMPKTTANTRPKFRNSQGRVVDLMVIYDWPTFDSEMEAFYKTDTVVNELNQKASPLDLDFKQLVNEHTCHLLFSHIVSKAIEPFTKNHQFIYNYTLCNLTPSFIFSYVDDQQTPLEALIPFEIRHFMLIEHYFEVKKAFNNQGDNPNEEVLAINQALSYMLKAGLKYSVLTTLQTTWVFKREEDRVYVSRAVTAQEFLKVIFWLCRKAMEEEIYADFAQSDLYTEIVQSPVERIQPIIAYSTYNADKDTFQKPRIARQTMEFTPIYHRIGYGRYGENCMAKLPSGKLVAMKAVDIYNRAHLVDELVAEARILYYAQQLGLRCTPKIYYSGYEDAVYTNLIEYLSPTNYYQKTSYEEMNHHEMRLFYDALVELASNAIVHGDLRPRHIFFSKDCTRCVIIDYGFGKIMEKAVETELEYEFDEHILSCLFPDFEDNPKSSSD